MFVKLGELIEISGLESAASSIPMLDPLILENFQKTATSLKRVAPKAEDFLYFGCVMMHAAEAAAINDDGTFKINANGQNVEVGWDKSANTLRWITNDPRVLPYRNSNGDIFPEEELVKAYKKWVGKPLCVDHQSSSVEHVRGFIVDTYYDRKLKRVVALCALDKAGYPQLARQVSTGVSTNVSMGTAVGRAICADCAKVASVEADFCQHMRHKSGYGEINVDLNPIELSIVVNGADPKANIKNVLAAANSLHAYVKSKEVELNKNSKVFNYSLSYSDDNGQNINVNGTESDLENFRSSLSDATAKLEEINSSIKDIESSGVEELAPNTPTTNNELAPPQERFASLEQLNELTKTIESKLSQMKNSLDKLANNSKTQEDNMSKKQELSKVAYPLGTVEPTKYPVDPANEKARFEDKHMTGVDNLGGPDGLAPGDLDRKQMLLRAEHEGRQLRRAAVVRAAKEALNKQAYPLGTEEPTTYPKDKGNEEARNKTDKHMNGKSPFPGVGKVDELYPEDKKKKELLNRASLSAKFVKNADKGESAWHVFSGDKLVLSASVNELSGGRSELLFESIATKEFGKNLILKVRKEGSESVTNLLKRAQMAEALPAPADAGLAPVPDAGALETETGSNTGDPATVVRELADKLRDLSSDLGEAVNTLVGEVPEMGGAAEPTEDMVTAANDETLVAVRNGLGNSLVKAMRESIEELNKHAEELEMIQGLYDNGTVKDENKAFAESLTEEAVKEAKEAAVDGFKLVTAFVKFSRGNAALNKKAQLEEGLQTMDKKHDEDLDKTDKQLADDMCAVDDSLDDLKDIINEMDLKPSVDPYLDPNKDKEPVDDADKDKEPEALFADDMDSNDLKATMDELKNLGNTKLPAGTKVEVQASANLNTKAGRAVARAQLAAEAAGKETHSLQQAHPKGGTTIDLDVKPSGDLAKVETIDEVHDKMLAIFNAPTPKVKKEAENLHKLVVSGAVSESDFEDLISEGLDSDAVAYYKKYYGEVDGGKEFAAELVKEHTKAEVDAQVNTYKVKLARAYELAYDMAERGLCARDRASVTAAVNEILEYNDEAFNSLKKVIARHSPTLTKEAGVLPQVGQFGGGDALNKVSREDGLYEQLNSVFSTSKSRMF